MNISRRALLVGSATMATALAMPAAAASATTEQAWETILGALDRSIRFMDQCSRIDGLAFSTYVSGIDETMNLRFWRTCVDDPRTLRAVTERVLGVVYGEIELHKADLTMKTEPDRMNPHVQALYTRRLPILPDEGSRELFDAFLTLARQELA